MKENVDFDKYISNFGIYIDELSKDFKKEKEGKKELILKFKELFSIDTQMKNFVIIFEYLENEIIMNKGLLLSSMKWNYVLLKLLKGSEKNRVGDKLKEIEDDIQLMKKETEFFKDERIKWLAKEMHNILAKTEKEFSEHEENNE